MKILTWREVQIIEKIIRQGWLNCNDPLEAEFESWLGVDQEQALALLAHIPARLPVNVEILPIFRAEVEAMQKQLRERRAAREDA